MHRLALIAVLAVVAGIGCGDSDDGGTTTSNAPVAAPNADAPPTTKKQYIATADAACSEFNGEIRKLPEPKDPNDIGPLYRKIAGKADTFYDKFSAIPKPRSDQRILDRYQRNLAESIALTKQAATVIEKKQAKALPRVVKRVQRVQRKNRRIATRFGFQVCGGVVR
jgi:hypothetical protein